MPYVLSPTEDDIDTLLRAFFLSVLPTGVEVVRGQANRVPEAKSPDFVVFTPTLRPRLATNEDQANADQTLSATQRSEWIYQCDVHGPNSSDNSQLIVTLFRDPVATIFFAAASSEIAPLYADDPKQIGFVNAEQQWEDRWVVEAHLQANQTVSQVPQQSATAATVTLINIEAEYPA